MTEKKDLLIINEKEESKEVVANFNTLKGFEFLQRIAQVMSASNMVPDQYKNNLPNCVIAMEVASNMKLSPFTVVQNLHVIKGRPSWSSSFIISQINSCRRFSGFLKFEYTGKTGTDGRGCVAYIQSQDGDILKGTKITIAMAKAEGWYGKSGSKWQTMPEQMLGYRSAAFFGRLYCPDLLNGMQTREEIEDIIDITPKADSFDINVMKKDIDQPNPNSAVTTEAPIEEKTKPKKTQAEILQDSMN